MTAGEQATHMRCPERPEGDNSTHHLVPTPSGNMVCRYCKKTRTQIEEGSK